jgi:hypothetical protein
MIKIKYSTVCCNCMICRINKIEMQMEFVIEICMINKSEMPMKSVIGLNVIGLNVQRY